MEPEPAERALIALLVEALARHPGRAALVTPGREDEGDSVVAAGEMLDLAARAAAGLRSLGAARGEPVLVWSENRERWLVADLALLALGCPGVPRGAEAPADEIAYIVGKVRARVAFVESPRLLAKLAAARHAIETVVLLSGEAPPAGAATGYANVLAFEELLARAGGSARAEFDADVAARTPDEVATIVFTSGTTGRPKGVVLTQGNLGANLLQVLSVISFLQPGGTLVSILPSWHMFERMVEYALLWLGLRIVYSDRRGFAKHLQRYRPNVLAAVPRLWLLLMEGVLAKVAAAPAARRRLVGMALAAARVRERARRFGGARLPAALCAPLDRLLRPKVLAKIAAALGVDGLRGGLAISGGGTLPEHVDLFFASLGVELLNGYGLTETSPVLTIRERARNAGGTVGPPLPRTQIRIVDPESGEELPLGARGVIHARGPQVMRGYFEEPEATAKVLLDGGWFDTGDLGALTVAGDVAITGRAKDTIVLLSGENVEPEPIENALAASPLIEQAVVVGQDRKQLAALIVPRRRDGEPARPPAELEAALRRELDAIVTSRNGFRPHERIARFRVLDAPLTLEDGFLSQTMKVKRNVVQERLAAQIEAAYSEAGSEDGSEAGREGGSLKRPPA